MVFGSCLGVLDSCADMDFLEQDYQTLQKNPPEVNAATPGKFGNTTFATIDLRAPSPGAERVFLSDPHSQVNSLLAPKLTDYAKKTQEQKERARANRRIRDQKKKIELKRKAEDAEALGRVQKARKELEREVTDLKSAVTTMQQPVRGSLQYYAHENAALKIKRAEDAKKYEEAKNQAKNQAEAHKEQIKQLEENFKKQTAAIKAQIRTAKTKHRQAQEEIVVKKEQHRTTLAAVTQDNADFL